MLTQSFSFSFQPRAPPTTEGGCSDDDRVNRMYPPHYPAGAGGAASGARSGSAGVPWGNPAAAAAAAAAAAGQFNG